MPKVENAMREATTAVTELESSRDRRIAAVFVGPMIRTALAPQADEILENMMDTMRRVGPDCHVWYLPRRARTFRGASGKTSYPDHIRPGMLIAMRQVDG